MKYRITFTFTTLIDSDSEESALRQAEKALQQNGFDVKIRNEGPQTRTSQYLVA